MSITKNIPVMIFGAILLGFIWPAPGLWLKPYLIFLLMMMMFFSCLKINLHELKEVPKNWWRYLVMLAIIFFVPSFIIFLFRPWLSDMIFVGLIIVAAMPAGMSIVFLSDLMGGEPTKALVVTAVTHILSPIITPLVVWFFAHEIVNIEFGTMITLIGKLTIIPLVLSQIVRKFENYQRIIKVGGSFNLVLLFLLVWSSISLARAPILANFSQFIISAGIILVLLAVTVLFGVWFGRNRAEDVTWAVSGTYKNFTLASVVALTMFGPVAMVGAAVYDVLNNILLIPIKWWATKTNLK